MATYVKQAMAEILDEVDWFDESTRSEAKLKVNHFLTTVQNQVK